MNLSSIVECPHCYTTVLPAEDGLCPACSKNVNDSYGTDPVRTSLAVNHGQVLPPCCCECGQQTDRFVTVSQGFSRQGDGIDPWRLVFVLLGWWISVFFFALAAQKSISDRVVVRVPQCRQCRKRGAPKPVNVNPEKQRMTFLVHRGFKAAVDGATDYLTVEVNPDPNPYTPPRLPEETRKKNGL